MNDQEKLNIDQALQLIMDDAMADAAALDGKPLSGSVVGTQLGQILASVYALAAIIQRVLPAIPVDNDPDGLIEAAAYEEAMASEHPHG